MRFDRACAIGSERGYPCLSLSFPRPTPSAIVQCRKTTRDWRGACSTSCWPKQKRSPGIPNAWARPFASGAGGEFFPQHPAFQFSLSPELENPSTAPPASKQRQYPSYADYVRHQQSKLPHLDLSRCDRAYREQLRGRLRGHSFIRPGASVLCLGARQGTEVKAFHDLGCFAVGLDLNPGPDNPLVLPGDFHNAPFPAASVDVIFTNSFDHSFDPPKLIGEIIRLLKPGGVLVVEAIQGEAQASTPDYYASFWWTRIDDLIALLERHGLAPVHRSPFTNPWPGEHLCLRLNHATPSSV